MRERENRAKEKKRSPGEKPVVDMRVEGEGQLMKSSDWSTSGFQPMKIALGSGTRREQWQHYRSGDKMQDGARATSEQPSASSKRHDERASHRSATPSTRKGIERKPSKKWPAFLRLQEEDHERAKEEARAIWKRLGRPTADCPAYPEYEMADAAAAAAKRGRQCIVEPYACGSNQTRRALRDHERSARKEGKWISMQIASGNIQMPERATLRSWLKCIAGLL